MKRWQYGILLVLLFQIIGNTDPSHAWRIVWDVMTILTSFLTCCAIVWWPEEKL